MIPLTQIEEIPGFIAYQGPSKINKEKIIVIVSGFNGSKNTKTGNMIQIYILMDNIQPTHGVFQGKDEGICGDCPHRYINNGSCYVNPLHGPTAVYNAYKRGSYPHKTLNEAKELLNDKIVRLGAYGDPAAVPITVWDTILEKTKGHTGYTHQWKHYHARGLKLWPPSKI